MISLIKGLVEEKREKSLVLLTSGGVGYKISIRPGMVKNVIVGQEIRLFIHSHIREDAFDLYGFEQKSELDLFELLLSVSGVGPKTALAVLGSGSAEEVIEAIARAQTSFFTATSGIGTKVAQRIIVDLQSKVGALGELDLTGEELTEDQQVIGALKGLGFKESEARAAVRALPKVAKRTIEQKVKWALKSLSQKR